MLNFSLTKHDDGPSRSYRRVLSILLVAVLIAIFASGYRYYTAHQKAAEREARTQIKAIGDLKAGELATWLKERKGDAETIFDSPVSDSLRAFLSDPAAPASRQEAVRWLASLIRHYGYSAAILLDPKGKIVLSSSSADETSATLEIQTRNFIERALHTRQVVFSDLYREGTPRLDFVVPLLPRKGGDELPIGALLLRVNPHDFLFPLIQTWPTASSTAETVLVRREGDDIVYLNSLRHQDHAPLTLRLPLISMPELPSVQGVRGEGEEVDGIDYRGVAVLAAVRSISDSPWYIVAKVDREEIEAPIRRSATRTGVIFLLLTLVAVLAIWLIWRRQTEAVLRDSQRILESQVEERTRELEREIDERKNYELRLHYQANHDSLTGLPNRTLLQDRLDHSIVHARRNNHSVAVMLLNIDRFKIINDSLDRAAGDALLKDVARRLRDRVREGDTVARLSGDEFVIVVEDLLHEEAVDRVARKVLQAMDDCFEVEGYEFFITCRVGISLFPRDGESGQVLLKNADAAQHYIKKQNHSRIQFYTKEMHDWALERLNLETALRYALGRDELRLYYQPQVDVETGQIVGVESLIRWQHPEIGLVSPAKFIPLAEETGLIIPIGEWVLRTACAQAKVWRKAGLPPVRMAVNLSTRQFMQPDLADLIARILQETGLEPGYLELEITESLLMEDVDKAVSILHTLKGLGVCLAIDDFGTGYSSLNYLKRFPIDRLKIDKSFVQDITASPDDAAITLAVIAMARSLKLEVIAEGVETEAQLAFLRSRQCHEAQGYYFSPPLTAEKLTELLGKRSIPQLAPTKESGPWLRTVLLIDDEATITTALSRLLHRDGYRILTATSARQGLELLARYQVGVVIADQLMPEMNGTEFLRRVRELYPDTVRIMLSGHGSLETLVEAINQGAIYKFLSKPVDAELLRTTLREAFGLYEIQRQQVVADLLATGTF